MALDPRISLAVQPAGILQAAQQGLQFGQQYAQQKAMNPLQQEALKAQTAQVQAETGKLDMAKRVAGAGYMANTIQELMKMPMEQRFTHAQKAAPYVKEFGLNIDDLTPENLTDEALGSYYKVVAPLAQMAQQGQARVTDVIGTPMPNTVNGKVYMLTQTRNPDGTITTKNIPSDVAAENVLDRMGLNAQGKTDREVNQATLIAQAQGNQALANILAQSSPAAQAAKEKEIAVTQAKANTEATAATIAEGPTLRDGLKDLHIGLDLVSKMKTGGWESIKTKAAEWLGVDTANESEFISLTSANLQDAMNAMAGVATKSDQDLVASGTFRLNIGNEANKRLIKRYIERGTIKYNQAKKLYENDPQTYSAYEGVFDYIPPKIGASSNSSDKPAPSPKSPSIAPAATRTPELQAEYEGLLKEYPRP